MENQVVDTLATLLKELQKYGTTESVIGKEMHIGEITIVPVSKISLGVGAGGGAKEKKPDERSGGGGGGGVKVEPIAFLVIHKDRVSLLNIGRKGPLDTLTEQVPGLLSNWLEKQPKKKKGEEKEEGTENK